MDIRHFRYFIAIAEEGQITAAARRLNMAQPPLSQALKAMEEELGLVLFERKKNAMTLTHEGEIFLQKALAVVHQFDETIMEVKEIAQEIRGVLSVGSTIYCSLMMIRKITAIREMYPLLTFRVWEGYSDRLQHLLEKRQIEIAITHSPADWNNVNILPLEKGPFVLVLPKQWTFDLPEAVTLDEVSDKPLILLRPPHGWSMFDIFMQEYKNRFARPNLLCECNDTVTLLNLVSAGFGLTILPLSVIQLFPVDNFRIVHIKDNPFMLQPNLVWRKNGYLSKAAEEFLRLFQEK
ncbi:LysR family transcriptional regulator [Brevibacillus sp. SYSU BS000544]|uniref:LysR family transcriptional regulator n=1 Tax=Brevibacillus sp. SYSU BS000544 TaxID=3416443 RepID=UPI003CE50F10